jgi:large subunit ribosomal protein L10Ae
MSKIASDTVEEAIAVVLQAAKDKKRKFVETIELQVALKNYDPQKDARFAGTVVLPSVPRERFTVCVIGNAKDIDKATAAGVPTKSVEDLKKLNKNKKLVKKLAAEYGAFLASSTIVRKIPRILGPGLNKAGKFPSVLNADDDIASKVVEIKSSVKFQLKSKKSCCLAVAVANVDMNPEDILTNVLMSVNFLASILPKNWQNIKKLYLKSTMGPVQKIFGF